MTCVVAVTGLSGVGKTTFLGGLQSHKPFLHLQAGSLIKKAREASGVSEMLRDELRHLDIEYNQKLLVAAFRTELEQAADLVILDGHTLIERDADLSLIPAAVFASLGIRAMIVLEERSEVIGARRRADAARNRPLISDAEIGRRQILATNQAGAS